MTHLLLLVSLSTLVSGDTSVESSPFWHLPRLFGLKIRRWPEGITTSTIRSKRLIEPNGCACNRLKCECCSRINFNSSHEVCLKITLIPNELTLRTGLFRDNGAIYEGTIGPSTAPICAVNLPGVCLVVNHVNIKQLQVCTKLNYVLFTLVKFPCTSIQDGKLSLMSNMYK
ncbi:unnamed protein product [Phaedon cochleariae]|uniref:DUF4773 domain-containing protein n=1 Tax=Phaedon cochleariae TaxID=80249 RepID=A0A9N9WZ78_PHACE|nr:unnamed protein product [Phaedon cochleariae]